MKILSIAIYDLIKLTREKTTLLIMLLIPVIFTLIMGAAFGNAAFSEETQAERKMPVGVASYDSGKAARELIDEINKDKTVYVVEVTEDVLLQKVKNAEVEVGFVIPEDFTKRIEEGNQPGIKTLKLPTSADYMAIQGIVRSAFAKLRVREGTIVYFEETLNERGIQNIEPIITDISLKVSENLQGAPVVSVEMTKGGTAVKNKGFDPKSQVSVGVIAMFVMFTVIFGAGDILEEKKNNTWGRLNMTPTSKAAIVTGKLLGTFAVGWLQIGFLIVFGSVFMGVKWGNSLGASIILMSVYLVAVTSMGLFLSTLVKTNSQLGAFSSVLIVSSSMLSGCYWPIEIAPLTMQRIAALFPQYWVMKGLSNTVGAGLGIYSLREPLLALSAMAAVYFILSVMRGGFKTGLRKYIPKEGDSMGAA